MISLVCYLLFDHDLEFEINIKDYAYKYMY